MRKLGLFIMTALFAVLVLLDHTTGSSESFSSTLSAPSHLLRSEVAQEPFLSPVVNREQMLAHTVERAARGAQQPRRRSLGKFWVTCYQLAGRTATGRSVGPGSIAVDPSVVPFGTRLELSGIGAGDARDTGGAIKGRHLDWWRSSCAGWPNPVVEVFAL